MALDSIILLLWTKHNFWGGMPPDPPSNLGRFAPSIYTFNFQVPPPSPHPPYKLSDPPLIRISVTLSLASAQFQGWPVSFTVKAFWRHMRQPFTPCSPQQSRECQTGWFKMTQPRFAAPCSRVTSFSFCAEYLRDWLLSSSFGMKTRTK